MNNLLFCRPRHTACEIDRGGRGVDDGHHVDAHRAVQSELLRNARHLVGSQHDTQPQQHPVREGQQPQKEQTRLQKRRQAQRRDLLHPLVEAVLIPPRDAEQIQRADGHLHKQNAAALDVGEEYLDDAVGKGDQREDIEQIPADVVRHGEAADQHAGTLLREVDAPPTGKEGGQVVGKGILQADAEPVQLHRNNADQ